MHSPVRPPVPAVVPDRAFLHRIVDRPVARSLNCPLPILRTKKAIAGLDSGQILEVLATDPGSVKDIEAYCRQTGTERLESAERERAFVFQLRKA